MNRFVTTRGPARALRQTGGRVSGPANQDGAALHLLEVAFETEIRIARREHLRVDRPVSGVTCGAAFA